MVFLGERKAILPGAEAAAERFFFSAQTRREGERGKPKQKQIWIDFLSPPNHRASRAGREIKTEEGQPGLKPVSNNGFASWANPRAKFSRTCTT